MAFRIYIIMAAVLLVAVLANGISEAQGPGSWLLGGNAGTDPSVNFLGTTNNVAFSLRVNNQQALQIQPRPTAANLVGGTNNIVHSDLQGVYIGGGEGNRGVKPWGGALLGALYGFIGGGKNNSVDAPYATVGGGSANHAMGDNSTVAGGNTNVAEATNTFVGGGQNNHAWRPGATIAGGQGNQAYGDNSAIGGGQSNQTSGAFATVGGGNGNVSSGDSPTVGGGKNNSVAAWFGTIGGGSGNTVFNPYLDRAGGNYATVGGGSGNRTSGEGATIPGGVSNTAAGDYSFAAGRRAKANHKGSFVWGDSTDADVVSTANNQFVVRATGGVSITGNLILSGSLECPNCVGVTDVVSSQVQLRVNGSCSSGSAIRTVNSDGTVTCQSTEGQEAWLLGGNAGTNPAVNFLGTTDNVPLVLGVNNQPRLLLDPTSGGVNVTGSLNLQGRGNSFTLLSQRFAERQSGVTGLRPTTTNTTSNFEVIPNGSSVNGIGAVMSFFATDITQDDTNFARLLFFTKQPNLGYSGGAFFATEGSGNKPAPPLVFGKNSGGTVLPILLMEPGTKNVGLQLANETIVPTTALDINNPAGSPGLRIRNTKTPTGSADPSGNVGDVAWDDNFWYVKTSVGWKRLPMSGF